MDKQTGTNANGKEAKDGSGSDNSGKADDGKIAEAVLKVITRPARRAPRKRVGDASQLDTADDDKYDDAWLPEYDEGPADEKIVEEEWVEVKKPKPTR
ncbi:hypothetical protein CkaCkLH20_07464 [Colletotrichum karsti]|uniref:Uncharacterized protein n=1 Tax=Colletotrichum karsti TaxID=1095194 RepID=A0A9P6I0S4_9PEZI|nr:uncharacterized protein CkaCkLH20_07464 [Colletotrichum karsti]KAF9875198.1 hypothetical protein CkaCkLH20_07464 [Colletotrichum karsti]